MFLVILILLYYDYIKKYSLFHTSSKARCMVQRKPLVSGWSFIELFYVLLWRIRPIVIYYSFSRTSLFGYLSRLGFRYLRPRGAGYSFDKPESLCALHRDLFYFSWRRDKDHLVLCSCSEVERHVDLLDNLVLLFNRPPEYFTKFLDCN